MAVFLRNSVAKLQLLRDRVIAGRVGLVEIIQQTAALTHHFEQTTPRAVVFQVLLEVLGQMVDTLGEQRDLHVSGTSVLLVQLK